MPYGQVQQNPQTDFNLRFFVAPNYDIFDRPQIDNHQDNLTNTENIREQVKEMQMKYAAYVRISSDEQIGNFSLDAQRRAIETWVVNQKGILAKVYVDEGHSGRTMERPAFVKMRKDAEAGKFDGLIVHKFDRFARNRHDALAIKSLLRRDCGIKVFSVTEPSEDSDGPIGALIEGIMESVADWYSRNLGTEVRKGKKEKCIQGYHNNRPPFGYDKDAEKRLVLNEHEATGLRMAFEAYAEGDYSDNEIAILLNKHGYKSKTGRPFSKDTVRDILRSRTYLGKIKYQRYTKGSNGKRSFSAPIEWFDGQHEAIIDEELFEKCLQVRAKRVKHRKTTFQKNPYLLQNLVYCHKCFSNPPDSITFPKYGKMKLHTQSKKSGTRHRYYRCRASQLGYECEQKSARADVVENQVVSALMSLKPDPNWRSELDKSMALVLGEENLIEKLTAIKERIKRMDTRWDNGFISDEGEYIQQRLQLQMEYEQLAPVPDVEFEQTAELMNNFKTHWDRLNGDSEAQQDLIKLIVEKVYIDGDQVHAITMRSNCHIVLGHKINGPTSVEIDPCVYPGGSDGI
ncbi:MAG: recombinase family protein [Bacteroidota bacterium]